MKIGAFCECVLYLFVCYGRCVWATQTPGDTPLSGNIVTESRTTLTAYNVSGRQYGVASINCHTIADPDSALTSQMALPSSGSQALKTCHLWLHCQISAHRDWQWPWYSPSQETKNNTPSETRCIDHVDWIAELVEIYPNQLVTSRVHTTCTSSFWIQVFSQASTRHSAAQCTSSMSWNKN